MGGHCWIQMWSYSTNSSSFEQLDICYLCDVTHEKMPSCTKLYETVRTIGYLRQSTTSGWNIIILAQNCIIYHPTHLTVHYNQIKMLFSFSLYPFHMQKSSRNDADMSWNNIVAQRIDPRSGLVHICYNQWWYPDISH